MKLLLVGTTGLVGGYVLDEALSDDRIDKITVLSRRPLTVTHPRLQVEIIDFDHLPSDASWWKADAVICTLGTTIKKAGSKEAFKNVDFRYPLEIAKLALKHGTPTYVLNSATGADADSRFFYNQVKGQLEDSLRKLAFHSLVFVRPGLIGGKREEFRLGEEVAKVMTKILSPLLPRKFQMNHPRKIASTLLNAAIDPKVGLEIITSEQLL